MNQKPLPVVLVVEDDWLLRLLAVEIVEDAGLVAVEAANADEAIVILERRVDIALILTRFFSKPYSVPNMISELRMLAAPFSA
jgi:CheY-like chemotaxis protein